MQIYFLEIFILLDKNICISISLGCFFISGNLRKISLFFNIIKCHQVKLSHLIFVFDSIVFQKVETPVGIFLETLLNMPSVNHLV